MGTPTHFLISPGMSHKGACNQREKAQKFRIHPFGGRHLLYTLVKKPTHKTIKNNSNEKTKKPIRKNN